MNKRVDPYGNNLNKEDWSELDHILAARHYKRKAQVKADIKQLMLEMVGEGDAEWQKALRQKIESL